jgi:hypothetical protein
MSSQHGIGRWTDDYSGLLLPIMLIAVFRLTSCCSRTNWRVAKPVMRRSERRFRSVATSSRAALSGDCTRRRENGPKRV